MQLLKKVIFNQEKNVASRRTDYWCVVEIATGEVKIITTAAMTAASALKFGCCYGHGISRESAITSAHEHRKTFLRDGYVCGPLPIRAAA